MPQLLGTISARSQGAPVFIGAQRMEAIAAIGRCIGEHRTVTLLQLLNKDPSLVHEVVPVQSSSPGLVGVTSHLEMPLACLSSGISAGYIFALQHGFPPDTLMQDRSTTLLQYALSMCRPGRSMSSDISLLLGMGASVDNMVSNDCLHAVVDTAFGPAGIDELGLSTVSMLLDARARFDYSDDFVSPIHAIARCGGWSDEPSSLRLAQFMARFVKVGVDINRPTGTPKVSPLLQAIGSKNGAAVRALLHLGAQATPEQLMGQSLSTVLERAGLSDLIPEARAARMQAALSDVVSPRAPQAAAPAGNTGAEPNQPSSMPAAPSPGRRRSRDL